MTIDLTKVANEYRAKRAKLAVRTEHADPFFPETYDWQYVAVPLARWDEINQEIERLTALADAHLADRQKWEAAYEIAVEDILMYRSIIETLRDNYLALWLERCE